MVPVICDPDVDVLMVLVVVPVGLVSVMVIVPVVLPVVFGVKVVVI